MQSLASGFTGSTFLLSPHPGTCILGLLTSSYLATTAMATVTAPASYDAAEQNAVRLESLSMLQKHTVYNNI